jgi:hypothetical protein
MTELLTESFCERCGTRYDLGSTEPLSTARKTRGLVTGLRQFIMSQDSLQDSIDDAMKAQEEALAARQIDAFQEAFSFCFDCRRYTCSSCWNDEAGRCRSCVPLDGVDDLAGYEQRIGLPTLMPESIDESPQLTTAAEAPWPAAEPLAAAPALSWPSEIEVPAEETVELPEPVLAEGEPAEVEVAEQPIAATVESEPEPEAPATQLPPGTKRDLRDTFLRGPIAAPSASAPSEPLPESLAARRSQLDILGIDDPGEGAVSVGQREALPYRSSGAGSAAGAAALAAVWDASTRALEARAGTQRASLRPCGACGLTVSPTARFCRRCGAPQTLSA